MVRVCAITNTFNERFHLPRWLGYYSRQIGEQNCIILDHGSTDGSIDHLGRASLLQTPRSPFDDLKRARTVSSLVKSMLEHYDVAIYSDCDELVVPDPVKYDGLLDFFSKSDRSHYSCMGFNVIHDIYEEAALISSAPVLQQRSYCQFVSPMCKTLATRIPLTWGGGFHSSSAEPHFDDLFLFHLRPVDLGEALLRLRITRELEWADKNAGLHQRRPNRDLLDLFQAYASWPKSENFDEAISYIHRVASEVQASGSPPLYYVPLNVTPATLHKIPSKFVGLF